MNSERLVSSKVTEDSPEKQKLVGRITVGCVVRTGRGWD